MGEELEEGVQDTTNLSDIVGCGSIASECVDFVEQVDAPCLLDRVKDHAQLCGRLSHELCNQRLQPDQKQGQMQFAREDACRQRFANAGRPDEQQRMERLKPEVPKLILLALLTKDAFKPLTDPRFHDEI